MRFGGFRDFPQNFPDFGGFWVFPSQNRLFRYPKMPKFSACGGLKQPNQCLFFALKRTWNFLVSKIFAALRAAFLSIIMNLKNILLLFGCRRRNFCCILSSYNDFSSISNKFQHSNWTWNIFGNLKFFHIPKSELEIFEKISS